MHSIEASVADADGSAGVDAGRAAGFLGWVAESAARSTGADSSAARQWVIAQELTESVQVELGGLAYSLRGDRMARVLEIVATD